MQHALDPFFIRNHGHGPEQAPPIQRAALQRYWGRSKEQRRHRPEENSLDNRETAQRRGILTVCSSGLPTR